MHRIRILASVVLLLGSGPALSQALVWLPSAAIDQRFDDNYRLTVENAESISATRVVANLGLNRESAVTQFRALVRADALLSVSRDDSDELDSNRFAFFESNYIKPRSKLGVRLNLKRDTPNRDISADITDVTSVASDSGAAVTQDQNVDRKRLVLKPTYSYNLSRRTELSADYSLTLVDHGLPSCEDALATFDPTGEQENPVFTPNELDDFLDNKIGFGFRHSLSPISTFTSELTYSHFEADEEIPDTWVNFDDKTPDERCRNVVRNPRLPSTVKTTRFTIGYERKLSETLTGSGQIGYYVADSSKIGTDNPDGFKPVTNPNNPDYDSSVLDALYEDTSSDGYLFNLTLSKKTGVTTYSGKFGVEVFPSDIGDVVESLDLVGEMTRQLNPRLLFNFRIRAFEPDAISDENDDDEFARRFFSFEPKLVWNLSRSITVAGSYRYRRQKTQASPDSSESNAVLISLKYTPLIELNELAK